ncbi:receptor-like protein kinase ANXUR1 [Mercurialis annua]|uniref:receptor-like protein kinase ANXUR1 n=1 Tax=Mercurialis annua TaxID=3986 RepID=UPI00215EA0F9|nr:receptor-like protein kinase ANXUR1 [Mercurialis annua]
MINNTHVLILVVCISVLVNCIYVCTAKSLSLSCGSENGGKDGDGRKWESDVKYLAGNGNQFQARAQHQDSSIVSDIPFMNARIFKSEATYTLPIQPKTRYFLRFFFYPSEYSSLNISNSYFSVVAAGVTLMDNFSASITAQALTQAYLIKEYSLNGIDSHSLNVTFKPSDKSEYAFAFVNGIEMIPMPGDLFGLSPIVGFSDQSGDSKDANFETMYRLNVAGQYIPPSQDSGNLARTWYNDAPYIFSAAIGSDLKANGSVPIKYNDFPGYAAPANVYESARSMGPDSLMNLKFNLTWLLQVDPNFSYIVRFHFCEFVLTRVNQMAFNIYINNQTAQADPSPADIIGWTGQAGQPTYKDYMIIVNGKKDGAYIQIDLHPSTLTKPEIYDALLNGLEVFKVSDVNNNLAGPNPELSAMLARDVAEGKQKQFQSTNQNFMIGGAAGGAVGLCLVAAICFVYTQKKRIAGCDTHTSSWLPIYGTSQTTATGKSTISGKSTNTTNLSTLAQGLCRHFSLAEMKKATNSFHESNVIGVGGFGKVYKGIIDQNMKVAIKRSNPQSDQGINEFQTEIEMLSKLRHKHLVSLIGFCEEEEEMCLVYDYMSLGTLREHLYKSKRPKLSWKQRLEICIGAARGLHYLHTGAKYTIIHRDVKTTNILLDENWVAKVSDFGLSKTGPNMENGHVSTVVKGSFGYLDPEYFKRQQLTEKSDVYSFGVVLFEALCGRPALNPSLPKEQVSLADWALHCQAKGTLEDIIDPQVKEKIKPECLKKFAETAEKCLSEAGHDRPSMGDVLWNLEFALQLQAGSDSSRHSIQIDDGSISGESSSENSPSVHNDHKQSSDDHDPDDDEPVEIFSQIHNQKGR